MEDDFATLADKRIFPGDVLSVKDSEMFESRDIAGKVTIMRFKYPCKHEIADPDILFSYFR